MANMFCYTLNYSFSSNTIDFQKAINSLFNSAFHKINCNSSSGVRDLLSIGRILSILNDFSIFFIFTTLLYCYMISSVM